MREEGRSRPQGSREDRATLHVREEPWTMANPLRTRALAVEAGRDEKSSMVRAIVTAMGP